MTGGADEVNQIHQRVPRDGHLRGSTRHRRLGRQLHAHGEAIRFGLSPL